MQLDAFKHDVWWIVQIYYISVTYILKVHINEKEDRENIIYHLKYKLKNIAIFLLKYGKFVLKILFFIIFSVNWQHLPIKVHYNIMYP